MIKYKGPYIRVQLRFAKQFLEFICFDLRYTQVKVFEGSSRPVVLAWE